MRMGDFTGDWSKDMGRGGPVTRPVFCYWSSVSPSAAVSLMCYLLQSSRTYRVTCYQNVSAFCIT